MFLRSFLAPFTDARDPPSVLTHNYAPYREWERYIYNRGGLRRLDFFNRDLTGTAGAQFILDALRSNPSCTSLTLSSNGLGDAGMMSFLAGLKRLKSQDLALRIHELNLSGNELTDVSLHLLTLHLLQSSPFPPSLSHLYLTSNSIALATPSLPEFLGTALSSPDSALTCLSLTTNTRIGSRGLLLLLPHLKLGCEPQQGHSVKSGRNTCSKLAQLHLSVCALTPETVEPLCAFLCDPAAAASRLQALFLNGNRLSEAGTRRIGRTLIDGYCTGLIHLELLANSNLDIPEDSEETAHLVPVTADERASVAAWEAEEAEKGLSTGDAFKTQLAAALDRNRVALEKTRAAALDLLPKARVLFGPCTETPRPAEKSEEEVSSNTEYPPPLSEDEVKEPSNPLPKESNVSQGETTKDLPFHFKRLPVELQLHVLRTYLESKETLQYFIPHPTDTRANAERYSILSEHQLQNIVNYASSVATLKMERDMLHLSPLDKVARISRNSPPPIPSPVLFDPGMPQTALATSDLISDLSWEEFFLKSVACDRFDR